VRALARTADPEARLIVIGDGAERTAVEELARELGVEDRVDVRGEVFDYDELRAAYSGAVASLSPGYVGLSMTQSHAFGLPMIYARDEPHAPEIEAAEDGVNAIPVESDDAGALAAAMDDVLTRSDEWSARAEEISAECRARYSTEAMVDAFVTAIGNAASR
jgi:glycosyltransferase involved in cell wall biosynthesis